MSFPPRPTVKEIDAPNALALVLVRFSELKTLILVKLGRNKISARACPSN